MEKREVLTEVVQGTEEKNECLHVETRHKLDSTYPLHRHKALELNYLSHGEGLIRVVGDSSELVTGPELVLVGTNLEHQWAQPKEFVPREMDEITIHFMPGIHSTEVLSYAPMLPVKHLLQNADKGVRFSDEAIQRVLPKLKDLAQTPTSVERLVKLFGIIYELACDKDYVTLCSDEHVHSDIPHDSSRIRRVTEYINSHYREDLHLRDMAKIACMTPTSFSRFFHLRTHKSISDYIIDKRLTYAAKLLAETQDTVLKICYDCGFNNITNFNRLFKGRKGLTPTEYRRKYSTQSIK